MNYYDAKQRLKDKRWDYTCNNAPIGYCTAWDGLHKTLLECFPHRLEEYEATSCKHHTDGHETEEEARLCYQEYVLDHETTYDHTMSNQQQKCKECGVWTQKYAMASSTLIVLCDEHNNREVFEKHMGLPGWSCGSW